MYANLGENYSRVLLKAHLGTGADYISKIGTKKRCLNAKPEVMLKDFGKKNTLEDDEVRIAEKFLVRVASSC